MMKWLLLFGARVGGRRLALITPNYLQLFVAWSMVMVMVKVQLFWFVVGVGDGRRGNSLLIA